MKKFILAAIFICLQIFVFGQSETEPNDTYQTASEVLENEVTTASLGSGDIVDYHLLDFDYQLLKHDGNLNIVLEITNTGSTGTQTLSVSVYNSLTDNGELVSGIYFINYPTDPGETIYDTIKLCGQTADQFYLKIESTGDFDYTMQWYGFNLYEADDLYWQYNNTPATASTFSFNIQKEASIGYEFWGDINYDTLDYFTTTLPAGNYDSINLKIQAQNNQCGGTNWVKYACYKNGSTTPFATGYVGDNPAVDAYQTVFSNIPLNNMQAGDNLLVKFVSNGPFGYRFIYRYPDIYGDDEDNCCVYNAVILNEGETKGGTVGEYDPNSETFIDEFDTYRIVVPFHGSVKFYVTAENAECDQDYYQLNADILDRYGNELGYAELATWEYPDCNTLITDTLKIRGFTADTFYLRLHSDSYNHGKINYTLHYETLDSTDNIDVEPNETLATAIPIAPGEVKKGHVRFMQTGFYDQRDFYKGTMPADGNITVYLKTVYRGDYPSNYISLVVNQYFTGKIKPHFPETTLQMDSIYIDTFHFCGILPGDISFELRSSSNMPAFEYELSYEIGDTSNIDTDIEPNNSFVEARRTGSNITQKGHIHYTGTETDSYDYYKMIFTNTDSLKLFFEATNVDCYFSPGSNRYISIRGFNKNFAQVFAKNLGNNTNVNPGESVTDSVKIKVIATDTIYLSIEANAPFKYQFTTNNRLPYSGFQIIGDTAVCLSTQIYKAVNFADEPVTFNWSLPDGGGTISAIDSIATVNWTSTGNRRVSLYLSNAAGNSVVKQQNVIINGSAPTQSPIAYNFARSLSTNSLPPGTTCQWYKNSIQIPGATGTIYYAADAGSFTVKFVNDCGGGPASNAIVFDNPALAQNITFPHIDDVTMSPTANAKLQATSSSNLPVYYQKISGPANIQNDTLYITGAGTIIIKAEQPGDDVYSPANAVYDTITVIKGEQVITFDPIPSQIIDGAYLYLTASSSAGLRVEYSIITGTGLAVVYNGATAFIVKNGAGMVTVRASRAATANYNAAIPVDQTFCIGIRTLTPIIGDQNPCLNTGSAYIKIIKLGNV